ncbi:MAG TPA: chemotaxis protein CheA [Longimicrobiales bacterium]
MPRRKKQKPAVGDEPLSLNEIAALLLQVDATDMAELDVIRRALHRLDSRLEPWPLARAFVLDAAWRLDEIRRGRVAKPDAVVSEVGSLIERAMLALDGQDPSEVASSREATPASDDAPAAIDIAAADRDLLECFIDESRDSLDAAESALLLLESDPDDVESCNTVFRVFHTLKGTSAFLGLEEVTELAHRAESLLSRVREGEVRFGGAYVELALRAVDMLGAFITGLQEQLAGGVPATPAGYAELLRSLDAPDPTAGAAASAAAGGAVDGAGSGARAAAAGGSEPARGTDRGAESWVRVRTDRLDRLVDMVGELVVSQSMVARECAVGGVGEDLTRAVAHAGKIVRELQDLTIAMRMVPLKATFQKMARLARDVAQRRGKLIDYVMEAEDTEIDRNMVDFISDPLVHMVRNAVDHGIEPPDVREANGKPRRGTVRLAAYHHRGNVVIELQDDGRGLDRDRIVEKALARGLLESDRGLSDADVFELIFAPGFSTAEELTNISGRGVGMDVVRRNVEAIGGRVEIASERGKGTTFSLRLPLTLAITDGMLIRVGGERYIIPTVGIQMSFRPTRDALPTVAGRDELVKLRDALLPVVRLHRLFDIEGAETDPTQALLVVIGSGERRCALLVDELIAQTQVVAKPLGAWIGHVPGISGAAILGDGHVGLILDPAQIISISRQPGHGNGVGSALRSVA